MSIQRYARFAGDVMGEIYDGEWVHYSDHAAEAERLRAAVVEEQRLCALKTKSLGEQLAKARERLRLSENEEGIWLHVKTAKIEGAVLLTPKDEPRGPIAMATLRAALGEGGGK